MRLLAYPNLWYFYDILHVRTFLEKIKSETCFKYTEVVSFALHTCIINLIT